MGVKYVCIQCGAIMALSSEVASVKCPVCRQAMAPTVSEQATATPDAAALRRLQPIALPREVSSVTPVKQPGQPGSPAPAPQAKPMGPHSTRSVASIKVAQPINKIRGNGPEPSTDSAALLMQKEHAAKEANDKARQILADAKAEAQQLIESHRKQAEETAAQITEQARKEAEAALASAQTAQAEIREAALSEARTEAQKAAATIREEAEKIQQQTYQEAEGLRAEAKRAADEVKNKAAVEASQAKETLLKDAASEAEKVVAEARSAAEKAARELTEKAAAAAKVEAERIIAAAKEKAKPEPSGTSEPDPVGAASPPLEMDMRVHKAQINVHLKREARFIMVGMTFSMIVLLYVVFVLLRGGLDPSFRMMTYVLVALDALVFAMLVYVVYGHYREGTRVMREQKRRLQEKTAAPDKEGVTPSHPAEATKGVRSPVLPKGDWKKAMKEQKQKKTSGGHKPLKTPAMKVGDKMDAPTPAQTPPAEVGKDDKQSRPDNNEKKSAS